jgi:spore coat polysaccharide biosynthesis predicted glycosyltransferase SpsG
MKEEYWNFNSTNVKNKKGILITTGGSDYNNLSPKILYSLKDYKILKTVIIGPGFSQKTIKELFKLKDEYTRIVIQPKGLKKFIESSSYVITSAGSTVYEVIYANSKLVIFAVADNQLKIYNYLTKLEVENIGRLIFLK